MVNYNKIFPVKEYYKKFIIPINPSRYHFGSDKMVCPVHNDHDPSLGVMKNGVCHCFGCNFWGNTIELHQRVMRRHFNKYLNNEEAKKDLCRIFEISYDKLPKDDAPDNIGLRQELAIDEAIKSFDVSDFKYLITEGKKQKKGINYFNTLMMIMTSEQKERSDNSED